MQDQVPEPHYWFRAKRYGWGWTPSSWEGWALLVAWAVVFTALVAGCIAAAEASMGALLVVLLILTFASTLVLVWLSYRHGEPPRWRWGR